MNNTKGYVFISYSTKNQSDADSVRKILTENGIKTWMAPYDIPTGKSYMEVITPAIENSSIFLLLLTEEAEKSPWVPDELSIAKTSMPGRILPISKGTMPKGVFKLPLQTVQIQMVHNIQQNDEGMRTVVQQIKTRMSASQTAIEQTVQKFNIDNLSSLNEGRFLYLGNDKSQFSTDESCYFLYDKQERNVILTHLPDMNILGWVKCEPELLIESYVQLSPDGNYMFALKNNQIWVADIISHKWLIKRTNIKIKKNEMIHYSAWIQKSRIFLFGGGILSDRISVQFAVEINMHNGNQQRKELGKLSLCEVLGVRKSDGVEWLFFFTNRNGLIAIDPANMKYMDAPQSLLHKIRNNIPRPSNGIDQFSPDDTTFYLLRNRMGKRFVEIYDVEENLLRKEICYEDIGGFALLNDYRIIAYNRKTGTLYLHELRLQNNITIIQSGFFSGEPAFYNSFPISCVVDRLTSNYLFLALHPNGDRFRIVVVNHKNVIMAISNEQPILHKEWMTSEMLLVPSGCLVSFFVQKGQSEFRDNGVNSYVYHIEFHRENGQLVFEKYSRD